MWFKGIIIEVKDDYSLVMKDDSQIVRIKNKGCMQKGETIVFIEEDLYNKEVSKNKKNLIISMLSIAAILAIFILPAIQKNNINSYAVVSLDINPSIEFELDANKNIISINALNEDGKKLDLNTLKGLGLEEALRKLKISLKNENYNLNKDSIIVGFSFLTEDEDDIYENDVRHIIGSEFKESKTAFLKGTKETTEIAKDKGISLGRYEAKLSMDEDIMEDQIENMSVEEILYLLKNKKNIYLNEDQKEELQEELEDKLGDNNKVKEKGSYNKQYRNNIKEYNDDSDDDNNNDNNNDNDEDDEDVDINNDDIDSDED